MRASGSQTHTHGRPARAGRADGAGPGDAGVSDVVGSILLVGITVVMAVVMGLLILAFEGPPDVPHANLVVTLSPGQGGWGTGDESIRVVHNGGDIVDAATTTITYRVNTASPVQVTGDDILTSMEAAGTPLPTQTRWVIGQSWVQTLTLAATDTVDVAVVARTGTSSLLASSQLVPGEVSAGAGCPFDTNEPFVSTWIRAPSDVTTATIGSVTITVTLGDDCAGVDPAVAPHLFWRINPGTNPGYTDQGAMTSLGANQWSSAVPDPVWATVSGQNLQYYVSPLADLRGNSGDSAGQSESIDILGLVTAVTSHTSTTGAFTLGEPFANTQGVLTDGLLAKFEEGATTAVAATIATNAEISASGWGTAGTGNPKDATASDDKYRDNSDTLPAVLRLGFPNPTAGATITAVHVKVEQSITSFNDNTWIVAACVAGGGCGTASAAQVGSSSASADTTLTFDITNLQPPGVTTWTWTDINNLEVTVLPGFGANLLRDGSSGRVDYVTVEVSAASYATLEQFDWTGVPAGTIGTHILDLGGCSVTGDTYSIYVWDWTLSAWSLTPRATLSSPNCPTLLYTLTPTEYQSGTGDVRIKFVDAAPGGATQGTFRMDYARIDTL